MDQDYFPPFTTQQFSIWIPTEILMRIFTICCPIDHQDLLSLGTRRLAQPIATTPAPIPTDLLSITHVCSRWRVVAIRAMPRLWSALTFVGGLDCRVIEWARVCLDRSQSTPLFISLDLYPIAPENRDLELLKNLLHLLLPHHPRWKSFRLQTDGVGRDLKDTFVVGTMPLLQTLNVEQSPWVDGEWVQHLVDRAPALSRFRWTDWTSATFRGVQQLTHLVIPKWLQPSDLGILQHCPHLTDLTLAFYDPGQHDANSVGFDTVTLPSIRSLVIEVDDEPKRFFDTLVLPGLCILKITVLRRLHTAYNVLHNYICRHNIRLAHLTWEDSYVQEDPSFHHAHFFASSNISKAIEKLHIAGSVFPSKAVEYLMQPLAKLLHTISVQFSMGDTIMPPLKFTQMLTHRISYTPLIPPHIIRPLLADGKGQAAKNGAEYFHEVANLVASYGVTMKFQVDQFGVHHLSCHGLPQLPDNCQ